MDINVPADAESQETEGKDLDSPLEWCAVDNGYAPINFGAEEQLYTGDQPQ